MCIIFRTNHEKTINYLVLFRWRNQDDKLSKKRYFKEKRSSKLCNLPSSIQQKKNRIILNNRKLWEKITKFMIFPQRFVKNIVETRRGTSLQTAY